MLIAFSAALFLPPASRAEGAEPDLEALARKLKEHANTETIVGHATLVEVLGQ